jgi:hypothetical protein
MTDFDVTTNRIPFDLLTEDERAALKSWPHGWAYFTVNGWAEINPKWAGSVVYRGKPAPVVVSHWFNVYPTGGSVAYKSRKASDVAADPDRIAVLRIDTCNGVSTAHLEGV